MTEVVAEHRSDFPNHESIGDAFELHSAAMPVSQEKEVD